MPDSLSETGSVCISRPFAGAGESLQVREARFVSSDIFQKEAFGKNHPLSIPRQAGVLKLCSILGWLDEGSVEACGPASEEQLSRFHDPAYINALKSAEKSGMVSMETRQRHNIGTMENPVFEGLFQRAATCVGGSIRAAELVLNGGVAFHPAGGTHHGRPDRASGFCYFNDPVFAILSLLDGGLDRVLYIDLDAHHGDGVQDAMVGDERVFTISIHEQNRWPYSGQETDRGRGSARNLPVPPGFNDSELDYLLQTTVIPLSQRFKPEALVITCGADALAGDPLSKLELSNIGLWRAVESLVELCPNAVVLGGGGYNPWTTVRCWTGLWGRISGKEIPVTLPSEARMLLQEFSCDLLDDDEVEGFWINTLVDMPNPGPVREEVKTLARQALI